MSWGEWSLGRFRTWTREEEAAVGRFLSSGGLLLDEQRPDFLVIARDQKGDIIGTGALSGNVLKQIMVHEEYRGTQLFAEIVNALMEEAAARGFLHVFVFTKPEAVVFFRGLGFTLVAETDLVALLEHGKPDLEDYLERLRQETGQMPESGPGSKIAGIVVNCNPFTRGHRFLVETASRECHGVHVFVVTEDRSLFPTRVRFRLVKEGTTDLPNVVVHEGGPYIISAATFPNYFLRRPGDATRAQAELDATIFGKHIAPIFGIQVRYVGEEPLDATTCQYNEALSRMLPRYGVSLKIVPRLCTNGAPVSASSVRKAIQKDDWETVSKLVPESTLRFLKSAEAKPIIERIRASGSSPH